MVDIHEFYSQMEEEHILLSFKGEITSELLTSILQIVESKLDNVQEVPKVKKKVYNILVECLQNLYHHTDTIETSEKTNNKSGIFLIARTNNNGYKIITGNYIFNEHIAPLKAKIDKVNSLDPDALKEFYKETLNNGVMSEKGGGGLGMIDIARKSKNKLEYEFKPQNDEVSFFTLKVKVE